MWTPITQVRKANKYIYMDTHTHIYTYTHIYTHTHIHTHTHIYIHTHTHTHTHCPSIGVWLCYFGILTVLITCEDVIYRKLSKTNMKKQ